MPVQHFSTDLISEPVVTISWDLAYSVVDIAYRGQPLTRITDPTPLRSTGMHGATPDGSKLEVHLRSDSWDGRFEVNLDGTPLVGAPVLQTAGAAATAGPSSRYEPLPGWQQYGDGQLSGAAAGGPTSEQAQRMKTGRTWLKVQGVLTIIVGILLWSIGNSSSAEIQDPEVLRLTGIIMGGLGILYLVFSAVAKGRQAKTIFGVALALAVLNLLAGVGQMVNGGGGSPVLGIIISAFAAKAYHSAMKAAGEVRWPAR